MFNYMEYIYQIYLNKSFSKAAKVLFISQPALSNIVKKVEDELNVILFNRKKNPITLTEAGEIYIRAAEKIMAIENTTRENLRKVSTGKMNSFTIAAATYYCTHILPEIIDRYKEVDPQLRVNLVEIGTGELGEFLMNNLADIGISLEKLNHKLYQGHLWYKEEIILAVPIDYEINQKVKEACIEAKDIISGDYLKEDKFVNFRLFNNESFIFLKKGNDLYERAYDICYENGFTPNIIMHMDQLQTSFNLAKAGKGIVFIRDGIVQLEKTGKDFCYYRLKSKLSRRDVLLYHSIGRNFTDSELGFIRFLKNNFPE